jgi:hypothetical protein
MMGAREISTLHESKRHGDQGYHQGNHSGDQELVQEKIIALVLLHAGKQALVFFSQWHNGCKAQNKKMVNAKNAVKVAALALLAVVAVSTKSLYLLLSTLHSSEDLWSLMATSARRRPKIML